MVRMKGQFMLLSAVIVGLTVMTVGSVVSEIQSTEFNPEDSTTEAVYLENEAEKVTEGGPPTRLDRENFRKLVANTDYSSQVEYWNDENCFNVTLTKPSERIEMTCIG